MRMMKDVKKSGPLGQALWVLGTVMLGWVVTGCGPECVDRYDCANKLGSPEEGRRYVCESNQCVVRDIDAPPAPEADAGTSPDAGADAGTPPDETDAGTPPDETDAGTDAGTELTCADLPHDPKLGTLRLRAGFTSAESAPFPTGISAITPLVGSATPVLYGLLGEDKSIFALGTWPNIAASTTPLYPVVAPADQGVTTYLSNYLTSDGTRLLAGYTKGDVSGNLALYDLSSPGDSSYVSSTGNYSVVGVKDTFLVNSLSLEAQGGSTAAIYALKTRSAPFQSSTLATFPAAAQFSGYNALASNGVAVFGYAASTPTDDNPYATTNYLHAVSPATYTSALSAGTSVDLNSADTPEFFKSLDVIYASGFGAGVAIQRGGLDESYNPRTESIVRVPLSPTGSEGKAVNVGDIEPVLDVVDACTRVLLTAPLEEDLLVGVQDKNGRRLVRLQLRTP
ncbi:hypothetical protein [Melittangium boletus]|nr:hypothetical protein [Melittangium boletus]